MDSLTQIALGASVGEAVIGRKAGKKGLMWGALCGVFPDLDVFIPFDEAVKNLTYHRGFSHSFLFLTIMTPVFVAIILKLHPETADMKKRWISVVYLAFITHVLLDCFTVYGTQIFWPLPTPPVMGASIYIVDPLYTVPLLIGVIAALIASGNRSRAHIINTAGLVVSSLYLAWTMGAKLYVTDIAKSALDRQQIGYTRVLCQPGPLNSVLWRVLVMDENGYYEGYHSFLDDSKDIVFTKHPVDYHLLDGLREHWPVKRLEWFTHGFYSVEEDMGDIVMTDLRMGLDPTYVFQFKIAKKTISRLEPIKSQRVLRERDREKYRWAMRRIFHDS